MNAPRFPCPCCGCLSLLEPPPGTFKICPVCWWEDDDQAEFPNRNRRGGTNRVSLGEAQANYRRIGATEEAYVGRVRRPRLGELPEGRN